jgi:hypothetical protein
LDPSQILWVRKYAAELYLGTGEQKSESEIVRDALDMYRKIVEADGVVRLKQAVA